MKDYSTEEHDEWDNYSVGSLAITDTETGIGGKKNNKKKNNGDADDSDCDSNSPEGLVKKKNRAIAFHKVIFLVLLVLLGVIFAVAAYLLAPTGDSSIHAGIVGAVFAVLLLIFLRYDYLVTERTSIVMDMAIRSRHIVDQLFPSVVRDRLLNADSTNHSPGATRRNSRTGSNCSGGDPYPVLDMEMQTKLNTLANQRLSESAQGVNLPSSRGPTTIKNFLATGAVPAALAGPGAISSTLPIAEQFKNTTVLFADIAGFTKWSSEREPAQVFKLLETVYGAFDEMADKLNVFKVETIGDSYMAVSGLPEPDERHAVSMARFAYQIIIKMQDVCHELEGELGPETCDLAMRVGLHSGPVTAGVLRGVKSRFQLFGDTVNTASRMESTGTKDRIQVSLETAELLMEAGKTHWIQERTDKIMAKGKGELQTYWLEPRKKNAVMSASDLDSSIKKRKKISEPLMNGQEMPSSLPVCKDDEEPITVSNMHQRLTSSARQAAEEKYKRLIDWNTDIILKYLAKISACRGGCSSPGRRPPREVDHKNEPRTLQPAYESRADVIEVPPFNPATCGYRSSSLTSVESLRKDVHMLVSEIAVLYEDLPYHNFQHASHVTLAANKLVTRMVSSGDFTDTELYSLTYGISSDALTQFAIVFAALIHDLGHPGITNAQLVSEESPVAQQYKFKSVTEQNSVSVAWSLLMQPRYQHIRECIYKDYMERKRFRQVLINAVLATDICDRGALQEQQRKWTLAFRDVETEDDVSCRSMGNWAAKASVKRDSMNRKATVVIEHLIQAANVSHTMQGWTVYRKWNERLFSEVHNSFLQGRTSFDPKSIWFQSELSFFCHYVIPLAKKLKSCGVFGPSGDQYLGLAVRNREEWELKGQEQLKGMIAAARVIEQDQLYASFAEDLDDVQQQPAENGNHTRTSEAYGESDVDSCIPVPEHGATAETKPQNRKSNRKMPPRIPSNDLSEDILMPDQKAKLRKSKRPCSHQTPCAASIPSPQPSGAAPSPSTSGSSRRSDNSPMMPSRKASLSMVDQMLLDERSSNPHLVEL